MLPSSWLGVGWALAARSCTACPMNSPHGSWLPSTASHHPMPCLFTSAQTPQCLPIDQPLNAKGSGKRPLTFTLLSSSSETWDLDGSTWKKRKQSLSSTAFLNFAYLGLKLLHCTPQREKQQYGHIETSCHCPRTCFYELRKFHCPRTTTITLLRNLCKSWLRASLLF